MYLEASLTLDQALGQCRQYIAKHYPGLETMPVNSTSLAAKMASEDPTCLAISSLMCAELYDLDIVDREIQDGEGEPFDFAQLALNKVVFSA